MRVATLPAMLSALLLLTASACSDYAVHQQLRLADSLCAVDADSAEAALNSLQRSTTDWKEADRIYFNTIRLKAKEAQFLRSSRDGTVPRSLLREQADVMQESAKRTERILATVLSALLLLLLVAGGLTFRYAVKHRDHNICRETGQHRIAVSPEREAMRKRLLAGELPTEDEWSRFQTMIDCYQNAFSKQLAFAYGLSEQELRVCLLTKARFKPSEIALLTSHSKEAITSTRRRLYKKITGKDGTPEMLDAFLMNI